MLSDFLKENFWQSDPFVKIQNYKREQLGIEGSVTKISYSTRASPATLFFRVTGFGSSHAFVDKDYTYYFDTNTGKQMSREQMQNRLKKEEEDRKRKDEQRRRKEEEKSKREEERIKKELLQKQRRIQQIRKRQEEERKKKEEQQRLKKERLKKQQQNKKQAEFHNSQGNNAFAIQKWYQALQNYQKACQIQPGRKDYQDKRETVKLLLEGIKEEKKGQEMAEQALSLQEDNKYIEALFLLQNAMSHYKNAEKLYLKIKTVDNTFKTDFFQSTTEKLNCEIESLQTIINENVVLHEQLNNYKSKISQSQIQKKDTIHQLD